METLLRRYGLQLIVFALLYAISTQLPRLAAYTGHSLESFDGLIRFALEGPLVLRWFSAAIFVGLPALLVWHFLLYWKETRGVASLTGMGVLLLAWPFVTFSMTTALRVAEMQQTDQQRRAALEALSKRLYKLPDHEFTAAADGHYFRRIKLPFQRGQARRPNQGADTLSTYVQRVDSLPGGFALTRLHLVQPWQRSDAFYQIRPGEFTDREPLGPVRTVSDTLCVVGYGQVPYADVSNAVVNHRSLDLRVVGVAPGSLTPPSVLAGPSFKQQLEATLEPGVTYLLSSGPHLRRQAIAEAERKAIDSLMAATGVIRAYTFLRRKELWLITAETDSLRSGYIQMQRNGPPDMDSPDYFPPGYLTYEESVGRWYRFTYRIVGARESIEPSSTTSYSLRFGTH